MLMLIFIFCFLGLVFGSFVNAWVWRVYQQSLPKSKQKKKVDLSIAKGRSACTRCGHGLSAKDLVPVLSWLSLQGKCRYCKKAISWQYPLVEVITAGLFMLTYVFWPKELQGLEYLAFSAFLALIITFMALIVYDIRWMLLPNRIVVWSALFAVLMLAVRYIDSPVDAAFITLQALGAVAIAGGIFLVLFYISNGRWIGGGDVKLGLVIGLFVGSPIFAVLMLFVASVLGTLFALPFIVSGNKTIQSKIPFGPFLVIAAITTYIFGQAIISWYLSISDLDAI
jgi:leader peptidase (prepilin peptidase) / N-methyltransferase